MPPALHDRDARGDQSDHVERDDADVAEDPAAPLLR
jgi:hypothetical protein